VTRGTAFCAMVWVQDHGGAAEKSGDFWRLTAPTSKLESAQVLASGGLCGPAVDLVGGMHEGLVPQPHAIHKTAEIQQNPRFRPPARHFRNQSRSRCTTLQWQSFQNQHHCASPVDPHGALTKNLITKNLISELTGPPDSRGRRPICDCGALARAAEPAASPLFRASRLPAEEGPAPACAGGCFHPGPRAPAGAGRPVTRIRQLRTPGSGVPASRRQVSRACVCKPSASPHHLPTPAASRPPRRCLKIHR
jgi:hypothetical protein